MPNKQHVEVSRKPRPLAHQRPIRLFKEDDDTLRKLHDAFGNKYDIDIVKLIRESVHLGLPIIEKQFQHDES